MAVMNDYIVYMYRKLLNSHYHILISVLFRVRLLLQRFMLVVYNGILFTKTYKMLNTLAQVPLWVSQIILIFTFGNSINYN